MTTAIRSTAAGSAPLRAALTSPVSPDTGAVGALLGAVLVLGSVAASLLGLGQLVLVAYPLVAVGLALFLLLRGRWYSYLAYAVIVWLTSHGVRRFVDWQTVYHSFSTLTITGALVSLAALPWALSGRRPAFRDVRTVMVVGLVVVTYGLLLGMVRNGALPALADFLSLAGPLVLGLFVLAVPGDDARLRRVVQSVALWGTALLGTYAIVQFLVLPPWDEAWIIDSEVSSIGQAQPGSFRAFATLSTTGPLGQILAAFLLLLVAERRTARQLPVALVGLVALGITLVRAGWIGLVLGVLVLGYLGRARAYRLVGVIALLLVMLVPFGGPIYEAVSERAASTAEAGTEDTSFKARLEFQAQVAPETLSDPVGDGMGATGVATDLSETAGETEFRNFDSGLFETLTRYGILAGGALLCSVIGAVVCILRRARGSSLFDAACAAAILGLACGLVFTDTLRATYGAVIWLLIAMQGRPTALRRTA